MNLTHDFDKAAAECGDSPALISTDAAGKELTLTYTELADKVRRAAAGFKANGIGKGDAVAIIHRNDPAFIIAYFGLIRLGAIAVPLNFMIQKPEELKFLLGHCKAKGVVTQRPFLPGIIGAQKELPDLQHIWISDASGAAPIESFWDFVEANDPLIETVQASVDDTLMVLYTSGTTGEPKGVELTHRNLVSNCMAVEKDLKLTSEDNWIALLPMFHTFCWTACVLLPLRLGAKIVIAANVAPPEPWLGQMKKHAISVFCSVPQVYALLSNAEAGYRQAIQKGGFLDSVKVAISGAAPLNQQIHDSIREAFNIEITEGYGLTETAPAATLNPIGGARVGSVGKAVDGVSIKIVNEEGEEAEIGDEGEILIKGPNVMKGYLNNPGATRAAIDADGWFRSGDIGLLDGDDYLHICDRIKDMIIVKGLKVFPAQIEKKLAEHPAIAESAVLGVPDETQDETIKVFVVLRQGTEAASGDILDFCRKNFDAYKRPKLAEIVESLPKNALNKTLKRVLRDQEIKRRKQLAAV